MDPHRRDRLPPFVHDDPGDVEGRLEDHWKLGKKRRTIVFDFKTDKGIDGINFTVGKKAKLIRFALHVDGKNEPARVRIGAAGARPPQIPFDLVAHP